MGQLSFFENLIDKKLLSVHTSFIGRVLSTNGVTAKIEPLGMSKPFGRDAIAQSPLSNVPILHSARYKLVMKKLKYVSDITVTKGTYVTNVTPEFKEEYILVPTLISAGDLVLCVCCERDITRAKKGDNSTPALGHHSMSDSVVVGIL